MLFLCKEEVCMGAMHTPTKRKRTYDKGTCLFSCRLPVCSLLSSIIRIFSNPHTPPLLFFPLAFLNKPLHNKISCEFLGCKQRLFNQIFNICIEDGHIENVWRDRINKYSNNVLTSDIQKISPTQQGGVNVIRTFL